MRSDTVFVFVTASLQKRLVAVVNLEGQRTLYQLRSRMRADNMVEARGTLHLAEGVNWCVRACDGAITRMRLRSTW
jgi:hypothetical protein